MTAKIIDGKKIAKEKIRIIKKKVETLLKKPSLAVILAGDDPSSEIYVKNKIKQALDAGFNSKVIRLDKNCTKEDLTLEIEKLNKDKNVNAVLLQLPLPSHLDEKEFLDKIDAKKDVDGFNSYNAGRLFKNNPSIIPCTPKGIMALLDAYKIDVKGKTAVVIGRSNIAGKPLSMLLLNSDATVIIAHSKTKNLGEITKLADILISAAGCIGLIGKDMVKEGAVVIDVGIKRDKENKIKGDVIFDEVIQKASYITPVPGGVGPMTIASLIENTYQLYLLQEGMQE